MKTSLWTIRWHVWDVVENRSLCSGTDVIETASVDESESDKLVDLVIERFPMLRPYRYSLLDKMCRYILYIDNKNYQVKETMP